MKTRNKNQISCDAAKELMFEYLDGELDSRTSSKLTAHILECEECQSELENRRMLLDEIRKVDYHVPEALHGKIMARVGCTVQDKPSKLKQVFGSFSCRTAAIGTFAAACIVLFTVILNRGYVSEKNSIVEPIVGEQLGIVAEEQYDGIDATETVGALTFSSPMASADTTSVDIWSETEVFGYSLNEKTNPALVDEAYRYNDGFGAVTTDTVSSMSMKMVDQMVDESPIVAAVRSFIKAGTAVIIIPVDSKVGADDGEVIKLSGLENMNCREIIGDKVYERLLAYESELKEDGAHYQIFLPNDAFDSLIIMNSEFIEEDFIAEVEDLADDEAEDTKMIGEFAQ